MKLTKSQLREIIREELESINKKLNEFSTLGVSGLKSFARKYKYSVRSKKSGGRVPLMYLSKDGKQFGPFDPTITTKTYLLKQLGLNESIDEAAAIKVGDKVKSNIYLFRGKEGKVVKFKRKKINNILTKVAVVDFDGKKVDHAIRRLEKLK